MEISTMDDQENAGSPKRQYPPFYEKAVPIALAIIAVAVVILVVVALLVVLGIFPGSR
jgi:hypothetical protein